MRSLVILLCFVIISCGVFAQNNDVFISVAMPTNSILDSNTKTILKNKLLAICTAEGGAVTECGAIAMIPDVSILDEKLVEGSMRNIYTIELCITVSVRNVITNTIFNTLSISTKGEGYSKAESLRSAIKKINENMYGTFAQATKKKVADYYSSSVVALINKANTLTAQQQYEEAIALLTTYPESLAGYPQISIAIQKVYQQYLTQNCEEVMMMARAEYAKRNFERAADLAASVNPTCSCFNAAKSLLISIKKDADIVYQNEFNDRRESLNSQERITTATINAARDVAVAYYKRLPDYVFFW